MMDRRLQWIYHWIYPPIYPVAKLGNPSYTKWRFFELGK